MAQQDLFSGARKNNRSRRKHFMLPRMDEPMPIWMIFPVVFAALYASHFTLMRLPYYWDEAGYYIPAAWDFFRTGSLIPISTASNAHPPLPSIYLALWWKVSGFYPEVTREAVLMIASLGLLGVWRLAMRLVGSPLVGFFAVLLTGIYPVWFAQSTLAHSDMFAAACTLWGLVYALPDRGRRPAVAAMWFTAAALCKETAVVIPLTLAAMCLVAGFRALPKVRYRLWKEAAWLAICVVPLAAWYAYHYAMTGFVFGNAGYLRYNAQDTLQPMRIAAAFVHRLLHLTAHMNMFVPVLLTCAAMMLKPRLDIDGHDRTALSRPVLRRIGLLLLVNTVLFSVLGGALLTRYLLPMYPLVLLVAVATFYRRVPWWPALAVFSAGAFAVGLFINPPYGFAPEDNLAYARVVRMHEAGIAQLTAHYRGATVLSAWPVTDELSRPELGYVKQGWDVYRVDDFTQAQIERAAAEPENYSAALVFSTKYGPPSSAFSLGPASDAMDERYFGMHHDLPPEAIAQQLHGTLIWKSEDNQGQWIALLRFERQFEASAGPPGSSPLPLAGPVGLGK